MAVRSEDACTLGEAGTLVRPVVERGSAHHEIERPIGELQLLGRSGRETQPLVSSRGAPRRLDHARRRIDSGKLARLREAVGEPAEEIAAAAADVEDAQRPWAGRDCDIGRPVGDAVMELAPPPDLVAWRPLVEGLHLTVP